MGGQPCARRSWLDDRHIDLETPRAVGDVVSQRLEQAIAQHTELQGVENAVHQLAIDRTAHQIRGIVKLRGQRNIAHELGQASIQQHLIEVIAQRLPHLARNIVSPPGEVF